MIPFLFIESEFMASNVIWFCFLYLIGAYLKRNDNKIKNTWKVKLIFSITILTMWVSSILIQQIYEITHIEKLQNYVYYLSVMNSPFMLAAGVSIFIIFKDMHISSKAINTFGGVTFACYLLHEFPLLRELIWKELFHTEFFYNKSIIIVLLHMVLCIVLIFIVALIIESIRKLVERKIFSLGVWKKIDDKLQGLFDWT